MYIFKIYYSISNLTQIIYLNIFILYMKQLNLLVNRLKKYKLHKIKNIEIIKKQVVNKRLIKTEFVDNKIRLYIKDNIKNCYIVKYKYKNIIINLAYYCCKLIDKELLKTIIKRIIFTMDITNIYKNVNIDIYDTPFKKHLPCEDCGKKLTSININSGLSYNNNIIIYRKEELLKVLIHEMIHILDIDIKYENDDNKKIILNKLCVNSLLINESYVETWANILNIYLTLIENNGVVTTKEYIESFIKEKKFSIKQCCKIIMYFKLDLSNNSCKNKIYDKTNILSYILLKTYNLIYINKFLKKYKGVDTIIVKKYNYLDYINYLDKIMNYKINIFEKNIEKIKETKYNLNMNMTICK